jgi:hypothetical protein
MNLESLSEDETPDDLRKAKFHKIIPTENQVGEIIILNLEREEIEFEDEYEYYEERNQLLSELISCFGKHESLLFLHRNSPHFYEEYDLKWFSRNSPNSKTILFGGGEDKIYDLYNQEFGLLNQVGNFASDALNQNGEIKQQHFEKIWNCYFGESHSISFEEKYRPFEELMTALMPSGTPNSKALEMAKTILSQNTDWLSEPLKAQIQLLVTGNSTFDWIILKDEWTKCFI